MLESPRNIEEAKDAVLHSSYSDFNDYFLNKYRKKALIILIIGAVAGCAFGLWAGALNGVLVFMNGLLLAFVAYLPVFGRKSVMRKIQNGEFFLDKSEEEIMRLGTLYVKEYNAYHEIMDKKDGERRAR